MNLGPKAAGDIEPVKAFTVTEHIVGCMQKKSVQLICGAFELRVCSLREAKVFVAVLGTVA